MLTRSQMVVRRVDVRAASCLPGYGQWPKLIYRRFISALGSNFSSRNSCAIVNHGTILAPPKLVNSMKLFVNLQFLFGRVRET